MAGFLDILANFIKIGVSLTDEQIDLLKWRMSDDSKKYYSDKESRDFYKAVKNGDTSVIDAIRKEKQKRIDDMKSDVLSILLFLIIPFISSCSFFPDIPDTKILEQQWDSNSLTTKDKTYKFSDQIVKLEDSKDTKFNGSWFIVNEDFIKTHNENQDTLIKALEKVKELKQTTEGKNKIFLYSIIGIVCLLILRWCLMIFIKRRSS
jgi:uncharacterized protein YlzI (FlbEa/FlbD family)